MSSQKWQLRAYREGDEPGIAKLFERGYGRRREPGEWRWKYRPEESPSTLDSVFLAVDADNRPVFHYGGVPRRLDSPTTSRQAIVAFDAVTDPDFRRQGIFSEAMETAHAAWRAHGMSCILGLPNEQWGSRVRAFDWRELFALRWQIRITRPEAILARRLGLPAVGRLSLFTSLASLVWRQRHDPDLSSSCETPRAGEIAELWQLCREQGKRGFSRDLCWLDARFLSCPRRNYRVLVTRRDGRLAGYLVFRLDGESRYGFIAELLTLPDDQAARQVLLGEAVAILHREGAVAVASLAVAGTELHASLRRSGFRFSWGAFTVRCVPLAKDLAVEEMREAGNWWLCGGDFDVI